MRIITDRIHCSLIALRVVAVFCCSEVQAQILVHFDLPEQALAQSLKAIGSATNTDVGFSASQVAGLIAPLLKADLTVDGALVRVLAGTGLRPRHLDNHTIVITVMESTMSDYAEKKPMFVKASALVKEDDQIATTQDPRQSESSDKPSSSNTTSKELDEIVVTGTNIRGNGDTASPLRTYSRADIDQSGAGTVQEFVQRLTQNFNGGAAENTFSTGSGTVTNLVNGSGINLRGLGNSATLILVDGHRVAAGNYDGGYVDISMIPLTAVERVEVLTDGASAIYGADAVGGVVNFILRKNVDGFETRARFGEVSNGGTHESQIGQTIGHGWNSGSALLSYEFYDRTPLSAASRTYSDTAPLPFSLLPEQVRNSFFANFGERATNGLEFYGDGSYSHRGSESDYAFATTAQHYPSTVSAYGGTGGALISLPNDIRADLSTTYDASDVRAQRYLHGLVGPRLNYRSRSEVLDIDAKVDGSLFSLPTGSVRFAVGAQFRREEFASSELVSNSSFGTNRRIAAEFAELRVPLVGSVSSDSAGDRLTATLAVRHENYSDFGSTNNPQFGLIWRPSAEVKIRATYGTSFRAPILSNLNPIPSQVFPFAEPDPKSGTQSCAPFAATNTCTDTLLVFGGNPNLEPEKAKTWTAGFEFTTPMAPGLKLEGTYYNIRFSDQISVPQNVANALNVFAFEGVLGPQIIQRNPPASRVQQYASAASFIDPFGIGTNSIGAIFDGRYQNISIARTSGIDLNLSYQKILDFAEILESIDATRILKFDNQFSPTAPTASILDTPYNPTRLRLRSQTTVKHGPISIALFANYIGGYSDNQVTPSVPVASWTTLDATATYSFRDNSPLSKTLVTIGITNIGNRAPPFLANQTGVPINYDGANANPLGREFSIQASKQW